MDLKDDYVASPGGDDGKTAYASEHLLNPWRIPKSVACSLKFSRTKIRRVCKMELN